MNCWHCGTELIWGADHDIEDLNDGEEPNMTFSPIFCPKCHSYVEVFHYNGPRDDEHTDNKIPSYEVWVRKNI